MITVTFHAPEAIEDRNLKYAVIAARYENRWIFCRHSRRTTWELPGGHREPGETIWETAKRELWEETGAEKASLIPVCVYKAWDYGMLYFAEIQQLQPIPQASEIGEICFLEELPQNLTYQGVHDKLFSQVRQTVGLH